MMNLTLKRDNLDANYYHFYYDRFYAFTLHTDVLSDILGNDSFQAFKEILKAQNQATFRLEQIV